MTRLITSIRISEGFGLGGLGNDVRKVFMLHKLYLTAAFFFFGGEGSVEGVNSVVGSIVMEEVGKRELGVLGVNIPIL